MKKVSWNDESGKKHVALVRNTDLDSVAIAGFGISQDPPDVSLIDWDTVQIELHNELLNRSLLTKEDVERSQNGVSSAIIRVLKKKILALYR